MCIKISIAPMQPKQIINAIKTDIRSLLFVDLVNCISSEIRSFDSTKSDSVVKASMVFLSVMWTRKVVLNECPFPVVPSESSKYRYVYEVH